MASEEQVLLCHIPLLGRVEAVSVVVEETCQATHTLPLLPLRVLSWTSSLDQNDTLCGEVSFTPSPQGLSLGISVQEVRHLASDTPATCTLECHFHSGGWGFCMREKKTVFPTLVFNTSAHHTVKEFSHTNQFLGAQQLTIL